MLKTRPYITNLRDIPLDQKVCYMCQTFQMYIYYSNWDIDVQKSKSEKCIFFNSRLRKMSFPLSISTICTSMYMFLLSIGIYIMNTNTTNTYIVIPHQRQHCKLTPYNCCLSLIICREHFSFHSNQIHFFLKQKLISAWLGKLCPVSISRAMNRKCN